MPYRERPQAGPLPAQHVVREFRVVFRPVAVGAVGEDDALVLEPGVRRMAVKQLQIELQRRPEIQQMSSWLRERGEPVAIGSTRFSLAAERHHCRPAPA